MLTNIKEGMRALVRADASLTQQERTALYAAIENPLGVRRPAEETAGRVVRYGEAARMLDMTRSRVQQLVKEKRLVAVYTRPRAEGGRAIGVTLASLQALMGSGRTGKEAKVETASAAAEV